MDGNLIGINIVTSRKECEDILNMLPAFGLAGSYSAGGFNTKAEALNNCRIKEIHFAWDRYQDKDIVLPKLQLYAEVGNFKPHSHNAIVYTIVNFDTTFEQDLERIYTLRDMGYWAYIMIYDKAHCDPKYKRLQRWVNNRVIFAKCPRFEDYK